MTVTPGLFSIAQDHPADDGDRKGTNHRMPRRWMTFIAFAGHAGVHFSDDYSALSMCAGENKRNLYCSMASSL
jgi:hypothetical protein